MRVGSALLNKFSKGPRVNPAAFFMRIQLRPFAWAEYAEALIKAHQDDLTLLAFDSLTHFAIQQYLSNRNVKTLVEYHPQVKPSCVRCYQNPTSLFCTTSTCMAYCHDFKCMRSQVAADWTKRFDWKCCCGLPEYLEQVYKLTGLNNQQLLQNLELIS